MKFIIATLAVTLCLVGSGFADDPQCYKCYWITDEGANICDRFTELKDWYKDTVVNRNLHECMDGEFERYHDDDEPVLELEDVLVGDQDDCFSIEVYSEIDDPDKSELMCAFRGPYDEDVINLDDFGDVEYEGTKEVFITTKTCSKDYCNTAATAKGTLAVLIGSSIFAFLGLRY